MITLFTLSQLANITRGQLYGSDIRINHLTIDTRQLKPSDVYVALKGKNFDGHDFAIEAEKLGASALMTEKLLDVQIPQIVVPDTRVALGEIAKYIRETYSIPTVAITGSNGKTTTKGILANILSLRGQVLATQGTMNNDIGLPLTLFRQKAEDDFAVLELGTNHFGEIAYLANIAKPDIAAITLIGPAHLEALGDLDGVSRAKGEIFQGLKTGGIAIVNADQPEYLDYFKSLIEPHGRMYTFGFNQTADFRAENVSVNEQHFVSFDLLMPQQQAIRIHLQLVGQHNVNNALVAAACAAALNTPIEIIKQGLETAQAENRRLNILKTSEGATLIDDSYNAIPNAVLASIDVLAEYKGQTVFVFGGMAELGRDPENYYRMVGEHARKKGISQLIICDPLGSHTAEAFGQGAILIEDRQEFIKAIQKLLKPNVTVLFKARRGFKMEEVVQALAP